VPRKNKREGLGEFVERKIEVLREKEKKKAEE
jgi:hypothetical protein